MKAKDVIHREYKHENFGECVAEIVSLYPADKDQLIRIEGNIRKLDLKLERVIDILMSLGAPDAS